MKVARKKLTQALALVAKASGQHCHVPALENVMVTANGAFSMRATDIYSTLRVDIPGTGEPWGPIAVNVNAFRTMASKLRNRTFDITADDSGLVISAGKRTINLPTTVDVDQFPAWPSAAPAPSVEMTGECVARMLDRVLYAVSTDETRQHLHGVRLESRPDSLRAIATDGHRLSLSNEPATCDESFENVLVEPNHLRVLRHALKWTDSCAVVQMSTDEDYCRARVQSNGFDVQVAGQLRQSNFPPYDKVIPSDWMHCATVDRQSLVECLKLAKGLGKKKENATFRFNGAIELKMHTDEGDLMYSETLDADVKHQDDWHDLLIGFNVSYLLDAMAGLEAERVELRLNQELDPVLICESLNSDSGSAVVMPKRL